MPFQGDSRFDLFFQILILDFEGDWRACRKYMKCCFFVQRTNFQQKKPTLTMPPPALCQEVTVVAVALDAVGELSHFLFPVC